MKIFVLDDDRWRIGWFLNTFGAKNVDYARDPIRAVVKLCQNKYDTIFLDHDLGGPYTRGPWGDGIDLAKVMSEEKIQTDAMIILHSMNKKGAVKMRQVLENTHRHIKYTPFFDLVEIEKEKKDKKCRRTRIKNNRITC